MFWKPAVLIVILLICLCLSIKENIKLKRMSKIKQVPQETVSSLISQALTQLVGVAGGIYLSLVMLTSFVGMVFPESIQILGISLEPLALISIIIALFQPWLTKLYYSLLER